MATYRGAAAAETASGTSHVVTAPSGIQDGDLLLVGLVEGSGTATINSVPSGWTQLATGSTSNFVYWKIASSEGASWTWGASGTSTWAYIAVAAYGTRTDTPVNDYTYVSDAGGTTINAPSLNPLTDTDLLICFFMNRGGGFLHTTASGMTEFSDVNAGSNIAGHSGNYLALSSVAATGTKSVTCTSATVRVGYSVLASSPPKSTGLFFGINH